jgi:glycine/D-amino acid oxidase-like deaminating enzyme
MASEYYPTYERASGWNALLPKQEPTNALTTSISCDVAIVGAGYTGLAAARRWTALSGDDRVVILEASEVGEGTPGRNSGFLIEIMMADDANTAQVSRMLDCNRLIGSTVDELRDIIEREGIDCGMTRTGTYRAAAGKNGQKALAKYQSFLQSVNLDHTALDRDELLERIGTGFYQSGIYSPHCHMVQPAALVKGLASSLSPSVSIYENSPAMRLDAVGSGWRITTPKGCVNARRVVLANNAYSRNLVRVSRRIAVIYTYAALSERLDDDSLRTLGSDAAWGLLPALRVGSTLRRTDDGRILTRAFWGYEKERDNRIIEKVLRDSLRRRFPQIGDTKFSAVWSGATGLTINGSPIWGEIEPGLFVSAGCNGGGVVKGTLFGGLIADKAHGNRVPDIQSLFGQAAWMPPDPFRWAGNVVLAAYEKYRGAAEL